MYYLVDYRCNRGPKLSISQALIIIIIIVRAMFFTSHLKFPFKSQLTNHTIYGQGMGEGQGMDEGQGMGVKR